MTTHPADTRAANPRIQCSVCGQWKRFYRREPDSLHEWTQNFYGGCHYNHGNDHLAGDKSDVCVECCDRACAQLAALRPTEGMTP